MTTDDNTNHPSGRASTPATPSTQPPPTEAELIDLGISPSESNRLEIRRRALSSTYFFGTAVCQFPDFSPGIHAAMANWIQGPSQLKLGMAPRGHMKSHVWTIGDTLRRVTADPDLRALVTNETEDNIKKWLSVMQQIVLSPIYRWLFPEVVPDPKSARWNATQLELVRPRPHPQATIEAISVKGGSTSNHYNIIVNDDPVGRRAREQPSEMQKAIDHRKLCWSLMINPTTDMIHDVGTRWAADDYIQWVLTNVKNLDLFKAGAFKPDGTPVWPERFTAEALDAIRKEQGPELWNLQYLNEPLATGTTTFDASNLRWWHYEDKPGPPGSLPTTGIVLERPAHEGGKQWFPLHTLEKYQITDAGLSPESKEARTANIVGAITPDQFPDPSGTLRPFDILLLHAEAKASDPAATTQRSYETYQQWQPNTWGIEVVGGHQAFYYWILKEHPTARLHKLKTDTHRSKDSRIREFFVHAGQQRIYIHRDHQDFLTEYISYPNGRTNDLLDALAYLPQVWSPQPADPSTYLSPAAAAEAEWDRWVAEAREAAARRMEGLDDGRSAVTGY